MQSSDPTSVRDPLTIFHARPEKAEVTVRVYDVLGRKIRLVVQGANEGRHEDTLDASPLSSGTCILRLAARRQVRTPRISVGR